MLRSIAFCIDAFGMSLDSQNCVNTLKTSVQTKPYQQWIFAEKGGALTIVNKATGRFVDMAVGNAEEGAAVFSYTINGDDKTNANQKWLVEEAEK